MGLRNQYDVENSPTGLDRGFGEKKLPIIDETGAVPGESFAYGDSTYAKIQRFAGKYNIEQRGIERVPEDERTDPNLHMVATMVWTVDAQRRLSDEAEEQLLTKSNSGSLQTWSSHPLLSVRWRYPSSRLDSSTPCSPFSSSTSLPSLPSASSQPSDRVSVCVRWCCRAFTLAFTL